MKYKDKFEILEELLNNNILGEKSTLKAIIKKTNEVYKERMRKAQTEFKELHISPYFIKESIREEDNE